MTTGDVLKKRSISKRRVAVACRVVPKRSGADCRVTVAITTRKGLITNRRIIVPCSASSTKITSRAGSDRRVKVALNIATERTRAGGRIVTAINSGGPRRITEEGLGAKSCVIAARCVPEEGQLTHGRVVPAGRVASERLIPICRVAAAYAVAKKGFYS